MTYKITDVDPVTMSIEELDSMVLLLATTRDRKRTERDVVGKMFANATKNDVFDAVLLTNNRIPKEDSD